MLLQPGDEKMTTTIYSFHRAADNTILATALVGNVQEVAQKVACSIAPDSKARAVYVHNGRGVVAVLLCRDGVARDSARDFYMSEYYDRQARERRDEEGLPNDK